jgi:hypothetical protein
MPFFRPAPQDGDGEPVDGARLLAELARRWRDAPTLEYRSEAFIRHKGEFELTVRIHTRLRRPNLGRIDFRSETWAEASRVRVASGGTLYDRQRGAGGRTLRSGYRDRLTENIPHPLDEAGYSVDQFFSPRPFIPPPSWGRGESAALRITGHRAASAPAPFKGPAYRVTIEKGTSRDELWLDAISFAPLLLTRRGEHAGAVQELLRETFHEFGLGTLRVTPDLFRWTEADERGIAADDEGRWQRR